MDNRTPREDYTGNTHLRDWWKIVKENFQRIFSYVDEHKNDETNPHKVAADQISTVFGRNVNDELYNVKYKKASLDSDNTFTGENYFTGLVNVPGTLVASGSTSISGGVEIQTDNVMLSQSGDLAIKGDLFVKDVDILYELGQRASQGDIQDGLADKASLSQINTFTEENIYKSILRSEGIFFGSYDTFVRSVDKTKQYNVYDELAKIEGKADVLISTTEKSKATKLTDTKNIPLLDYKIYGSSDGVGVLDEATGEYVVPVKVYGKNLLSMKAPGTYNFGSASPQCELREDGSVYIESLTNTTDAVQNSQPYNKLTIPQDGKYIYTEKGKIKQKIYTAIALKRGSEATVYHSNQNTSATSLTLDLKAGDILTFYIQIGASVTLEDVTLYPQLEFGNIATSYEKPVEPVTVNIPLPDTLGEGDYVDYANKKIVAQGNEHTNVELPEIITNYPSTTIMCDGEMQITYKVDEVKAYTNMKSELDTLKQAVISLGGTL